MQDQIEVSERAIRDFESYYNVEVSDMIGPTIHESGRCYLSYEQVGMILDRVKSSFAKEDIIQVLHPSGPSFSMSLFVLNEATWKLMERKEMHQDRMLPMVTVPWFYWHEESRSKTGATRHPETFSSVEMDRGRQRLTIRGKGGDFCGMVARSALRKRFSPWRILIPEIPDSAKPVPNYEWSDIILTIDYAKTKPVLYPPPRKELDYTFSESPKVFYKNGLEIEAVGEHAKLKIGKREAMPLRGKAIVLIGRPSSNVQQSHSILSHHLWLRALYAGMVTP